MKEIAKIVEKWLTLKPRVIDLFSGCGGMSAGLAEAGFEVLAGIDEWDDALQTFSRNFPNATVFNADIRALRTRDVLDQIGITAGEVDVIIGGPPCQGFSKNTPASLRFIDDPRNQLFREFMRFVTEIQPPVVVMENVAEIFNAFGGRVRDEIARMFIELGYQVEIEIHNAANFGVPQKRRRCIFFASRTQLAPQLPEPTHCMTSADMQSLFLTKTPTAWDAISDLPKPGATWEEIVSFSRDPMNDFQRTVRGESLTVANHFARPLRPKQRARYESLRPGQALKDLPDELRPRSGYSGAYGRLDFDCVAPTITRWVFHPGSGRFGHPVEPRILTMREAARIQSFPDHFEFVGSVNSVAGQIGNAVPPLLMQAFASSIRRCLLGEEVRGDQVELSPVQA